MNDLWILFFTSMMILYAVMFEMALSEIRGKHRRLGKFAILLLVLVWIPYLFIATYLEIWHDLFTGNFTTEGKI